ncbi:hypothetical protein D3C87_1402780 [compost metagenome]
MGKLKGAQHARCAHRTTTDLCLSERHRLSVGLQEKLLGGAGRCCFTTVVGTHFFTVPQHNQRATADARRLRFDQRQHGLHRNRRIDGRAAATQHLAPGFGCQRVGGCGHVFCGMSGLQVGAITGCAFRREWQCRGRSVVAGAEA